MAEPTTVIRTAIRVEGIVQGVGFRPFVHALATGLGLAGIVGNDVDGVFIEVEGTPDVTREFLLRLERDPPPLARIERVRATPVRPTGSASFTIAASGADGQRRTLIAADTATCPDCLRELCDPADRRFGYAFINCTNCGPRFTIVRDVPYDRATTTMARFPMCGRCAAEYHDPADRRFHAQPTCCPDCGPRLELTGPTGARLAGDPIAAAAALLRQGDVLAVKGLGGYHLAVDASCERAAATLRARKHREDKPFAVLAEDLAAARRLCRVEDGAAALLTSPARPIVLLPRLPGAAVAAAVAPGSQQLGIMLPYTPLHHLLLRAVGRPIVLTSGNVSDEPIAYRDDEAMGALGAIADAFLTHDRAIHIRTDDSVTRVLRGRPMVLRRSRGYVPEPLTVRPEFPRAVLACGAELKNTFCLARGHHAFVSQHIGDLGNAETLRSFTEGIEHFLRLFDLDPQVVAYDLHPEYLSTKYALERDQADLAGVQHHHAHIASCLADNGTEGPVIGVAFDGTGYGTDGTIWGGEFLVADLASFQRGGHLAPVPMPGGQAAIREPWRMAAAYLEAACPGSGGDDGQLDVLRRNAGRWAAVVSLARRGVNSPATSSAGRLFDAVAAILGLRDVISYEGQAAIELEQLAGLASSAAGHHGARGKGGYRAGIDPRTPFLVRGADLVRAVADDLAAGIPRPVIAARFHDGVAALIEEGCLLLRERHGLNAVALSGGVFQNLLLLRAAVARLEGRGFTVLVHSRVPCNDGGISLGQAVVAAARDRAASGGLAGLADPGERVADQQVNDPGAAERRPQPDHARLLFGHQSDGRRLLAQRVRAKRGDRAIGVGPRHHGDQASLAGHVHRVDPQQLAGAADLGPHRDVVLDREHAHVGGPGDLVEYGGHTAPGGVAHRPRTGHRVKQGRHQPVQRGGVRADVGLDVQLAAGQHDRYPVIADRPGDDDGVARPRPGHAQGSVALDEAHPGGADVAAVGLALLHHLGVAGDHADPGRRRGVAHGRCDPGEVGDGKAFLQDEAGRQVQRRGAGHGQVIDGAVDREVADVAARKEQRRDHVGIGGEGQPRSAEAQPGRVLELLEQRVAERVEEDRLDQRLGRLAPRSVRHRDPLFPDPGTRPAGTVDPVEHLLLAVGQRTPGRVHLARGHDRVTCASATRCRVIRP